MQSFRHQLRRNRVAVLAIFSIAALAALAACGTGENDTGPTAGDQQNNKIIRSIKNDSNVFAALHTSNLGEIAAAQIALTKATDTGVVAFARQMIIDHRMLDSSGTALANSLGIVPQLPDSTFPKATAAQSDTLNSMASGTAFDQTYIAEQINDHSLTLGIIDHSTAVSSDSTVPNLAAEWTCSPSWRCTCRWRRASGSEWARHRRQIAHSNSRTGTLAPATIASL